MILASRLYNAPNEICKDLIQFVHGTEGSSHLGQQRMFQFFCTHFYAPKIQSQIQHFVKTCTARQDEKRLPQRYAPGLSKTMSNITERLSCFYIDCVKLTKGRLGHKYLFTLMDPNTRWLEAYPIRNANSQNVARILESEIFPRYGYNLLFCLQSRKRVALRKLILFFES